MVINMYFDKSVKTFFFFEGGYQFLPPKKSLGKWLEIISKYLSFWVF